MLGIHGISHHLDGVGDDWVMSCHEAEKKPKRMEQQPGARAQHWPL